jgi:S1-C subfamily serine protease/putative intracellular protease/amidase
VNHFLAIIAGFLIITQLYGQDATGEKSILNDIVKKVDPSVVAIQHERALGSGFVITKDGYIMTNGHVVRGEDVEDPTQPAKAITVMLSNDEKYPARVIGFSMDPDVALIKIEPTKPLHPVEFADSTKVRIGDRCFAVGAPHGLKRTYTAGILSNIDRTDLGTETKVFQTDAAINPGNSGGPLFDREGRVLGLNTYGTQGANNLGFTIPIHVAKVLKDHFLAQGRFVRALVPAYNTCELYDELAQSLGVQKGVLVDFVMKNSAAEKAGLRTGDIIVETDGQPTAAHTHAELLDYEWDVMTRKPGSDISFTVLRGTKQTRQRLTIRASLEPMEPLPSFGRHSGELVESRYDVLGLGVRRLVTLHRLLYNVPDVQGVIVSTVSKTGPATKTGLKPYDVITHVAGQPTPTLEKFHKELESKLTGRDKAIELTAVRSKTTILTAIAPYYSLRDKKIAMLVPAKDPEYVELLRRELVADGAVVTQINGDLSRQKGNNFDVVLFTGGAGGHDFWNNPEALRIVKEAHAAKRILAGIGSSSLVLVKGAPELLKKKITTTKNDSAEAMKLRANYTGKDVETDGKIVTTTGVDRETVRNFLKALNRAVRNNE